MSSIPSKLLKSKRKREKERERERDRQRERERERGREKYARVKRGWTKESITEMLIHLFL